jgi:hypothetical protein
VSRQSLAKAHQKIQELSWEPQYHEPYMKYGTDYTFRKAAKKDPLKQVLRSKIKPCMSKYSVLGAARSSGLRFGRDASSPQYSETADGSVKQCESPGRFPRLFLRGQSLYKDNCGNSRANT